MDYVSTLIVSQGKNLSLFSFIIIIIARLCFPWKMIIFQIPRRKLSHRLLYVSHTISRRRCARDLFYLLHLPLLVHSSFPKQTFVWFNFSSAGHTQLLSKDHSELQRIHDGISLWNQYYIPQDSIFIRFSILSFYIILFSHFSLIFQSFFFFLLQFFISYQFSFSSHIKFYLFRIHSPGKQYFLQNILSLIPLRSF